MQQIVSPSKVVSFESTHLRFCPRLLWAMKSLVSSANQKAVASCRAVWWLFFPPMFFFLCPHWPMRRGALLEPVQRLLWKELYDMRESTVPVVARRTVEHEDDARVVVVFGRGACASRLCPVAPSWRGWQREVVSSSSFVVVCNGCGIFFFFLLLLQYCLFFHIVVVVHQRSFYSGVEDDALAVLVEVLVQPGLLLHYWGKTSAFANGSSFRHTTFSLTTCVYVISSRFLTLFRWNYFSFSLRSREMVNSAA